MDYCGKMKNVLEEQIWEILEVYFEVLCVLKGFLIQLK